MRRSARWLTVLAAVLALGGGVLAIRLPVIEPISVPSAHAERPTPFDGAVRSGSVHITTTTAEMPFEWPDQERTGELLVLAVGVGFALLSSLWIARSSRGERRFRSCLVWLCVFRC